MLIMNFLVMPTFFLSGALFPLEHAPKVLKTISQFNPLTYGVDGLREVLVGTGQFGVGLDLVVLSRVSMVLIFIGSRMFSKIQI